MNTSFGWPDLIPLLLYVALLLYLGYKARRKHASQEEFLLSSRSLTIPAFVATLVTTWYGGILGIGEFVYRNGLSVWFVFGLPYYIFALLFALFLASKVRQANNYSIPDMLYKTYGRPSGSLGSLFLLFMTSPAPYILMLAILIQQILHWSFILSILIGTFFSIVYVYKGGFRSVVETDKLQFIFMFTGFILLFAYLLSQSISPLELFGKLDELHKSPTGGLHWQQMAVWFLIASWTFIDPGFHQRCAAAKTGGVARKGIFVSIAFWFLFDGLTMLTGLYAVVLLPDINPLMGYPQLAVHFLPPFVRGLFFTGLFAIIMSTIDSYTFLSALTFGLDIFGHWKGKGRTNRAVQFGLVLTAFISIGLILAFPSVIQLWYNLGSLFIPPLLLPLLAAYFPAIRLSRKKTFLNMLISFLLTGGLFLWGQIHTLNGEPLFLLSIEPFFPGFIFSLLWYGFWKLKPISLTS